MYIPVLQVNLDNIFFKVIAPVGRHHLRYFIKCKSNIKNLETQVKKLEDARERVQHAIDAANRNGEEIEADVLSWLSSIDKIIEEAGKFLEEGQAIMMGAERWCPNLKSRYQLSKKATKMAQLVVAEIPSEGKFNQVAYHPAPQGLTTVPSSAFMAFESRTMTLNEIMGALKDSNINMIGVYGMSGVGKTALVKEVAIKAKEEKLFDVTIMVSVKQNPDPKRIQGEMADKLGLKFNEETVGGRADRLCFRIKKEEKILVILDDLWAKLDLEEVGVPFGDAHKGCKILLTSRTRDVLTVEMGTQKHFELVSLSNEESWSFFEMVALAGDDVRDTNLETIATEVANRCAGLPVIIVTVARALKGKDLSVWKEKLKDLENIDDNEGMEAKDKVYSALELSYNHLDGDEAKSLFLLCSLLPKYDIAIDYLSLCAMALGLFKHVNTLEEAKNRVHKWIDVLKGQCLLLDDETNKKVKMHDFVHDFAVSVASGDRHAYINDFPEKDMHEKCTMISFPSKEIRELPEELECPKLELIKLENTNGRMKIPETFFKGMKSLRLMDFSRMRLMTLPSLHSLGNLKMLRLNRCMFRDIAVVGELKRLEILLLTECDIHELPKEIGQLTCLRLLNLTGSSKLEVIPAGVILSLKNLEELYMGNSFAQWEIEELNSERGNASLHELKHLSKLTNLEAYIPDAKAFPKDLLFKKLERYVILIGGWLDWNHMDETSRTLKLKLNPSLQLEDGIIALLKKADSVYLDELNGVKSIVYELDSEGYKQLKHLRVQNNAGIQYIINSWEWADPCITFPVLESIFLRSLSNLEKICHGQLPEASFSNLRIVKVELCHRLKYLLSISAVPGGFVQLQELEINECRIMSAVFAEERKDQTNSAMDVMKFAELRSLTMDGLPKLMDFCSHMETPSTSRSLFNQKVSFPKLEALKLSSINLEKIWDENLPTGFAGFRNLTRLIVQSCGDLKYLLSSSNAKSLVQLNYLKICRCEVMEEVVVKNELGDEEGRFNKMFPKLEYLKLKDLPNLSIFCDGYLIKFQIKDLLIENCPKLQTFLSKSLSNNENVVGNKLEEMNLDHENLHATVAKRPLFNELAVFPNLEAMVISNMDNLEMIWDRDNQLTHECSFYNLRFMYVTNCEKLSTIFPFNMLRGLSNIETLEVRNCHSLEEISTCHVNDIKEQHDEITFNFKLEYLRLSNLPKLKHLWHDNLLGTCTFKNLRSIKVEECESLKYLIPACMGGDLVQSDDRGEAEEEIALNQLKYLKLRSLSNLTSFHSGKYNFKLPSLEEVIVEQCPKVNIPSLGLLSQRNVERVEISKGDEMVSFPKLEALKLSSINLERIWDENLPTGFAGFRNLTRLIVQSCGDLKYLLSSSNAKSLVQLNYLKICRCEVMEEVVVKNELGDEEGRFNKMFPKLEYLKLKDLPNLSIFCDGYLIKFQIKDLLIENCPKLQTFLSKSLSNNENVVGNKLEEMNLDHENLHATVAKRPLFNELAVFPNLEAMVISNMDNLEMIWDNQFTHECSFYNLRFMSVTNCEKLSAIFPFNMLRGLSNIETLEVRNCHSLEEISTCHVNDIKEQHDEITFNFKLEYLRLSNLPKLKHLWHDNLLGTCTFKNLRSIKVEECESLKYLIPACMGGDLVQSDDRGEAEEEIALNQLKYLNLRSLSNLTSFHSGKYNFKLPSLEEVIVEQCPKVNIPSLGLLSQRNVERVEISKGDEMHGQISESNAQRVKISSAATIIQRRFRSFTQHKEFNLLRTGIIILQSLCRVKLAIRQFELLRSEKAALEIQKNKVKYHARINYQERTYKAENGETTLVKAERAKTNAKEATIHSSQANSRSTKTLSQGTSKSYDEDEIEEEEEEEVTQGISKLSLKKFIEYSNEKSPKSSTFSSANESAIPGPSGTGTTDSNAPLSNIEEDDMEAFYASVGAKSESCQCQPTSMDSTTHAQCNKSNQYYQADIDNALELVNSVLATSFSSACDPGFSSYFKSALELLCGLDEHDGISVRMKPLVLQLSKDFEMMTKRFDWANETIERHNKFIQSKAQIEFQLNENKEKFLKLSSVEFEVEGQIKKLQQQINYLIEQRNLAKQEKMATFVDGKKLKYKLDEDVQNAGNVEKEKEIAEWTKEEIEEKWSGFTKQFLTSMQIAKP